MVGALVGAVGGAVYAALRGLGLRAPLAAIWALAAMLLATGALHEDGLADAADGLGGGRTPERRLEIMRDSRIGSFGALALLLSCALRIAAIAALPPHAAVALRWWRAARWAGRRCCCRCCCSAPARADGLGAALRAGAARRPPGRGWRSAARWRSPPSRRARLRARSCWPALAGLGVAAAARRLIGGYTGDVFGATSVVAECLVLGLLSTRSS